MSFSDARVTIGNLEQTNLYSPLEGQDRATACQQQWKRVPKMGSHYGKCTIIIAIVGHRLDKLILAC